VTTMEIAISILEGPRAGAKVIAAGRDSVLVGRSPDAQLCLGDDEEASFHHAVLEIALPRVVLRDLGGRGGVLVNGEPRSEAALVDGDRFRIGNTVLELRILMDDVSATDRTLVDHLSDTLPVTRRQKLVSVRCVSCGEPTGERCTVTERATIACFCVGCRKEQATRPPELPGYRIVRELGRGGMGVVYLAEHETLGRRVLKVMLPEAALREHARKLFVREAKRQAGLRHPNIVELFDFIEHEPGVFVAVLEHVDGASGDLWMERLGGRLPPVMVARIVADALSGLGHMHRHGLVHRDIKEGNLLLQLKDDGAITGVKIGDFGLAKSYEDAGASGLTRPGQVGGTIPYMAPEQIRQFRDSRPPVDLYAMGATLYRLLSGSYPHEFPEGRHPFLVVLADEIVPLASRAPDVPAALCDVTARALEKDPGKRFASAEDMRKALLAAVPEASA
jgi:eukaryotic-like serine/threonine-protein kinase